MPSQVKLAGGAKRFAPRRKCDAELSRVPRRSLCREIRSVLPHTQSSHTIQAVCDDAFSPTTGYRYWGTRGRRFKSCQPDHRTQGFLGNEEPLFRVWGQLRGRLRGIDRSFGSVASGVVRWPRRYRWRVFVLFGAGPKGCQVGADPPVRTLLCGTPGGGIAVPAPGSVRKGGWTAPEICEGFVSCRATDSCCRAGFRVEVRP